MHLDKFVSEKPCALARLAFEYSMFVQKGEDLMFFNQDSFSSVMKREIVNIHVFIKAYTEEQVW